jgi:hypothetical protein
MKSATKKSHCGHRKQKSYKLTTKKWKEKKRKERDGSRPLVHANPEGIEIFSFIFPEAIRAKLSLKGTHKSSWELRAGRGISKKLDGDIETPSTCHFNAPEIPSSATMMLVV